MSSASTHGPDDYLQVAAEWVVREAESDFSPQDARALAAWRAQDERHERAYAEIKGLWGEIPSLGHLTERFPLANPAAVVVANDDDGRRPRGIWRAVWPAGFAAAAAAVLAIVLLPGRAETSAAYATDVGQISEITPMAMTEAATVPVIAPRIAPTMTTA